MCVCVCGEEKDQARANNLNSCGKMKKKGKNERQQKLNNLVMTPGETSELVKTNKQREGREEYLSFTETSDIKMLSKSSK